MICVTSLGAHVSMTACLLFVLGCAAQKVYFDCGAKVDVVDVQGLVLSPGFPYNYSSGTHCVWQFVVPVDHQLVLEIFDFDVFESHDSEAQYSAVPSFEDVTEKRMTVSRGSLSAEGASSAGTEAMLQSSGDVSKAQQSSQDGQFKQVVVQEQSTKMELAKVSNSAKRSADSSSSLSSPPSTSLFLLPGALPPGSNAITSISSSHQRENLNPSSNPITIIEETTLSSPHFTETPAMSPETQQSVLDACPHDVLYISDLITFSSRFCGSNRPPSSQLVFGSSQEMVEVIMELITTTHWGRGFALLFHYHNLTEPVGNQHDVSPSGSKIDSLLAAVSGAAFFALILTSLLCIIFRPKMCPKRGSSSTSSTSEVPEEAQNTGPEISELQMMAESQTNPETTVKQENSNNNQPHTVTADGDVSQNAVVDLSCSGLTELDLGADEVFIVSSAASPSRLPFARHARERFLRHSDTGPGPSSDWPATDPNTSPAGARSLKEGSSTCSRPRAWSVRTFQDLLPPLPQLHKKWCSWNSTSPFTKLVDSAPSSLAADCRGNNRKVLSDVYLEADAGTFSDSSVSNASYPLTQHAQRQRRLNSTSNLRRSRFSGPCFGLLSETKDPLKGFGVTSGPPSELISGSPSTQSQIESSQVVKSREFPGEGDHISVPVFAISEEEDRQPLVSAEHLDLTSASAVQNGRVNGSYESKRPQVGSVGLSPKRARQEWRPWGSQVSGGVGPHPFSTFTESHAVNVSQPSIGLSAGLCTVMNQM